MKGKVIKLEKGSMFISEDGGVYCSSDCELKKDGTINFYGKSPREIHNCVKYNY